MAQLERAVGRIGRFDAQLVQWLDDIDAQMRRLSGVWSGQAAAEQAQAHQQWLQGAEEMRRALVQMRSIAETAHENYSNAVEANLRMWQL